MTVYAKGALLLLVFLLGLKVGIDHEKAGQLDSVTDAVASLAQQRQTSSAIGADTRAAAGAAQVANQTQLETSNERIQVVYRDRLVAADCVQPPAVMQQLEATRNSANGAVRAAAGVAGTAAPDGGNVSRH